MVSICGFAGNSISAGKANKGNTSHKLVFIAIFLLHCLQTQYQGSGGIHLPKGESYYLMLMDIAYQLLDTYNVIYGRVLREPIGRMKTLWLQNRRLGSQQSGCEN